MNRIILVGNGFDLAHGLRTSYNDFINYYFAKVFDKFYDGNYQYSDPLISIKLKKGAYTTKVPRNYDPNFNAYLDTFITRYHGVYEVTLSDFLNLTRANLAEKNWVDLEMDYFKCLCEGIHNGRVNVTYVKNLNRQLEFVKQELSEFLTIYDDKISYIKPDSDLLAIFNQPILWDDISLTFKSSEIKVGSMLQYRDYISNKPKPVRTMVVNFNYTTTLACYIEATNQFQGNTKINYIHGKLQSLENPPIFGFGDEYDSKYLGFEAFNENSLFEHVKSFRYFLTHNNKDLLRFVNDDMFQVYILGHSCGLTDRTMFKSILENKNCKSVKIFHHNRPDGTNDYHEKTIELGRHFSDKGRMREIIVDFDHDNYMPQPFLKLK